MERVVLFGATSAIAAEVGRIYACRKARLFLVGRSAEKLGVIAADLTARGAASVFTVAADLAEVERHPQLFTEAISAMEGIDVVLVAHGSLPDQALCQRDFSRAQHEIHINFISPLSLAEISARYFEEQGRGSLAVISSVAGDRGRQSNYIYGAAKGGLSTALAGIRNRVPHTVAEGIVRAIEKRKDVVYLPWFWCAIMLVIKHIPECVFKRLRL
ncbi:MAG: SDR family NAD(P)-dependent oxidoreductase [Proteobacteria bacterium]|nr:SDR family NAD(P)-dependent oxidoreductase [Pseudomonadota bacterium]